MRESAQGPNGDNKPMSDGFGSLLVYPSPISVKSVPACSVRENTQVENEREISVVHNFSCDVQHLGDALLAQVSSCEDINPLLQTFVSSENCIMMTVECYLIGQSG